MNDLLRRVRWTNLARAFALLLAVVVALILLKGKEREPTLPPALAEPPATVAEAGDEAPRGDAAVDDAQAIRSEQADARRAAAAKKAAQRRAAKRAAARRAAKRRRTAARRRAADEQAATAGAGEQLRGGGAAAIAPRSPGAEFRP